MASSRLIKSRAPKLLALTLLLTLLLAGGWIWAFGSDEGSSLEGRTLDWRAQQQRLPKPADVIVVAYDATYFNFRPQWPPSLSDISMLITELQANGAAAVVLDTPFDHALLYPKDPGAFQQALSKNSTTSPVILTQRPNRGGTGQELGPVWTPYRAAAATRANGGTSNVIEDPNGSIKGAEDITIDESNVPGAEVPTTVDPLKIPGVFSGVSARPSSDRGIMREYLVRGTWSGTRRNSVALATLQAAGYADAKALPDKIMLNWYGPPGTIRRLSAQSTAGAPLQAVKGKIVVVGPTTDFAHDYVTSPYSGSMPSAEVTATAIANLLSGVWLRTVPDWVAASIAMALALLVWSLLLCLPLGVAVPAAIGTILGYAWFAIHAFERGVVLPVLAPIVTAGSTFAALALILSALALRERLRIRGLFARYVPADVVRELVDTEDPIRLGGEAREVTVLFSDIRGFTTLSEHVDPEEMVEQLNEYFAAMVEVVGDHHGTLDKFLGDGLMAIFGAPAASDTHAADACACALEMLDRLEEVNADRSERELPPLHIGIGIHTGKAVVGNVGSPLFRVDFTAIGDTVNLASRLEGTTKDLGAEIVISAATADAAREAGIPVAPLGTVVVKGRDGVTEVYALGASDKANAVLTDAS